MEFRIADTFTDSLSRLSGQEQKAVKTTAFDLQLNPAHPSMQFHKLDRAKDPDFWSVRVSRDIRLIVHKTASNLLLCYVDHHDAAYAWAERRKIERHPRTGAAQLVEIRERVEEVPVFKPVDITAETVSESTSRPLLFAHLGDDDLLAYGVPPEWFEDVRKADEDRLFDVAEHLPQEAAEALLDLATGVTPAQALVASADADPFSHPDAQRRFRILTNAEELQRALDYPWEKWTVFLHPAQRHLVERDYTGPARVSGSAGTGKTIVALHRAVLLARRHPQSTVLRTTFSHALADALRVRLGRLIGNEPAVRSRIRVRAIIDIGMELYTDAFGTPELTEDTLVRSLIQRASDAVGGHGFSQRFLLDEWRTVVDAWQLRTWEAYRDVPRLGRKTRIGGKQRERLWSIFERVHEDLDRSGKVTLSQLFARVTDHLNVTEKRPFDFAVVDEAQDISVAQLKFLAALHDSQPDSLFFSGDLGQRIFQQPFSWKSVGVDVRGRSHTLRINYRTSHQIRSQADKLLPASITDVDGNEDSRKGTQSVFNGPAPEIQVLDDVQEEVEAVGRWIEARIKEGFNAQEIGVFVRTDAQLKRARAAVAEAEVAVSELSQSVESQADRIAIGTMHLAKGLEFRAVVVMACDDEVVPLQERIERVTDDSDLEEVYNTERHLLYVVCTRARDRLFLSGIDPASEFLDDMHL